MPPRAPTPVRPEPELLAALRAGDEAAFTALVDAHHGALVRFARAIVNDAALAEEVVQDAWVALLEGVERFEGRSSLRTWLHTVVANRAKSRVIRDGRMIPFSALEPAGEDESPGLDPGAFRPDGHWRAPPEPWTGDGPERRLQLAETRALLEAAVEALPPRYRAILLLRDVEGLDSLEACNVLGVTETNGRVLLHRARTRVRAALAAHLAAEPLRGK